MITGNKTFLDELNKEIDKKIDMIETGNMEYVVRLKKADYAVSLIIILISLIALVWAYFCLC